MQGVQRFLHIKKGHYIPRMEDNLCVRMGNPATFTDPTGTLTAGYRGPVVCI